MWQRGEDGLFIAASRNDHESYQLVDFATGAAVGTYTEDALVQIKSNSGIHAMIATALVRFQLSDPDKVRRGEALDSISRNPEAALLSSMRASIATETDPVLFSLERLMTMAYDRDTAARVAAIGEMAGDLSVDFRALIFLGLFLFIKKRTRLGLETRAVAQNPRMAASMGINPDRVNMLTFGLGSGIAGITGVAIGLFAKVTSEMGNDYIVQSFMTVVVGGVGNIWGTLAGQ